MNRQTVIAALIAAVISIPAGFGAGWFAGQADAKEAAAGLDLETRYNVCIQRAKNWLDADGGAIRAQGYTSEEDFIRSGFQVTIGCSEAVDEMSRSKR